MRRLYIPLAQDNGLGEERLFKSGGWQRKGYVKYTLQAYSPATQDL